MMQAMISGATRTLGQVTAIALLFGVFTQPCRAQTLTGSVSSAEEGPMEGVLISAQKQGSPITVTVVSDDKGHFRFPDGRLSAGHYALRIRAVGYDLAGPQAVDLEGNNAEVAVALRKTSDLAAQLTNTEWFMSMPGTAEQKRPLIECMSCHTVQRIVRSIYNAETFVPMLERMAQYANNSIQARVQPRIAEREVNDDSLRKLAAYLATVNLSHGPKWDYALKTLPRPKGRATHVVVTEYDMPRSTIAPHDVRTDRDGNIWYSNFVENFLGELDPKTGAHREYAIPVRKPNSPTGSLDLEADADGNLWLAMMFQASLARFDMATKTFQMYPVGADLDDDAMQQSMVMPRSATFDGKVWTNDVARQSIMRLDLKSGQYQRIDPFTMLPKGRLHAPYGMAADANNNLYFMDFGDENIGRVDARTSAVTIYPTPTAKSRPRRCMLDAQGHLWFTEFAANKLAMFDIKAERFKEWDVPTPYTYPYDVFSDGNGELWSGGMASDRVLRFDPQRGAATEYLLPRPTNIRRVFVDTSTKPVTFWAGNNHGASIVKLEPLD
ncbi:MAG TPA: carboxypeptidase regulatory-like domain-containing protein [Xanthobacteraceae bacterium]|jgi:streptogramin lyase|nr:carboxypeptidase regulatory-like domain-containing protein [Xanthobacteraceae bacterium]